MRVGVIDIGTNSVRFLVADVANGGLAEIARVETVTRLGQGVELTGVLAEEAMGRTLAVLGSYRRMLDSHGAQRRRAIATSACRDAGNAARFLREAESAAATLPEIIGGDEEARLAFRGATHGVPASGTTLIIDVGGGSTEFVAGVATPVAAPAYWSSVDIGSVRLTERSLGAQPVSAGDLAIARAHVDAMLASQPSLPPVERTVGVAGTFTSLAAIHLGLAAYERERVDGAILARSDLGALADRLAALPLESLEAIPALDPARAPVIVGGAIVAERALAVTGMPSVTVSVSDILDGVALSLGESAD